LAERLEDAQYELGRAEAQLELTAQNASGRGPTALRRNYGKLVTPHHQGRETPPRRPRPHRAGVRHKKILLLRKSRPGGGASLALNSALNSRRSIARASRPLVVRRQDKWR
jgi:hypothetical protein